MPGVDRVEWKNRARNVLPVECRQVRLGCAWRIDSNQPAAPWAKELEVACRLNDYRLCVGHVEPQVRIQDWVIDREAAMVQEGQANVADCKQSCPSQIAHSTIVQVHHESLRDGGDFTGHSHRPAEQSPVEFRLALLIVRVEYLRARARDTVLSRGFIA